MAETKNKLKVTRTMEEGLGVLASANGSTRIGRFNDKREGTIHHNTLKKLVEAGLAKQTTKTISLTAKGKKEAAARRLG